MAGNLNLFLSLISQIGSKVFFLWFKKNLFKNTINIGKPVTENNLYLLVGEMIKLIVPILINRFLKTFKLYNINKILKECQRLF